MLNDNHLGTLTLASPLSKYILNPLALTVIQSVVGKNILQITSPAVKGWYEINLVIVPETRLVNKTKNLPLENANI